ncbi:MAG: hypothetical protein SWO11_03970 [Thermodesulfobacteriota bacterium]|nr:hypothetical protein [Thermodesulfobacteriota bacterium]
MSDLLSAYSWLDGISDKQLNGYRLWGFPQFFFLSYPVPGGYLEASGMCFEANKRLKLKSWRMKSWWMQPEWPEDFS